MVVTEELVSSSCRDIYVVKVSNKKKLFNRRCREIARLQIVRRRFLKDSWKVRGVIVEHSFIRSAGSTGTYVP